MQPPIHTVGGIPVGLAGELREAVVSLGPDGAVEWANDAALALLRIDAATLVGSSPIDRLHPDEVARALDGIAFSAAHPDRTAVVPFRIRRGDDSWVQVELMSSVVRGTDGDHVVLVLRDASPRRAVAQALASVASGEPFDETARWSAAVIEARWPRTVAAVVAADHEGPRLVAADAWPADLRLAVLGTLEPVWRGAVGRGEVTVVTGEALGSEAAGLARTHGMTTFAVAPVADPGGSAVALLAWFDLAAAAEMEFAHASVELRELLGLALERRHHLARLDHAARHDGLTGLLDRTGFLDLARGTGSPAGGAALLYIDLDDFKPVNDRYGHAVGDAVLRVVAGRLAVLAGDWDVARIGGDEFVLLGRGATADEPTALDRAAHVVSALTEPIEVPTADGETARVQIGASVGVAVAADDRDVTRLLELADGAMYAVKAGGGSGWSAHLPT